jgi:hypothetical protein
MNYDQTIALFTLGLECGLAVGYGLCFARGWMRDCRQMVLGFCQAIGRASR